MANCCLIVVAGMLLLSVSCFAVAVIYTTNAIELVNMSLRKIAKHRGSCPSDEALLNLF